MTHNQLFPFTFELFDKWEIPLLQVNYNSEGTIGAIFTRNEVLDTMVKADLEAFEEYNYAAYTVIQARIDHEFLVKGAAHVS